MVLHDEIEQHSGFLLDRRVEVLTVPGLIDLTDGTMERLVLFVSEKFAFSEFMFEIFNHGTCIIVCRPETLLAR